MNLLSNKSNRRRGVMLLECVTYIGIFALLFGFVTAAFYECWDSSAAFRRTGDDVVLSLHAGEHWRADVRAATGPIQVSEGNEGQVMRIPKPTAKWFTR